MSMDERLTKSSRRSTWRRQKAEENAHEIAKVRTSECASNFVSLKFNIGDVRWVAF
jgi:hypothetical protein